MHVARQQSDLRHFMQDEETLLDPDMDYQVIEGLSSEVKERLTMTKPMTLVSVFPRGIVHRLCIRD